MYNTPFTWRLGVQSDDIRVIQGSGLETTEGARFWMKVFRDLEARGVQHILIASPIRFTGRLLSAQRLHMMSGEFNVQHAAIAETAPLRQKQSAFPAPPCSSKNAPH